MKEKLKKILTSRIFATLIAVLTLVWVYAPVVAGMLFLMAVWIVPIAFTSYFLFIVFGQNQWMDKLIQLRYQGYTPRVITLLVFEVLLFVIGFVLFAWGLIYIAKTRFKKEGLVTRGPYKYIRHPQHLGLILMAFSFSLYVPETEDQGILVAEILSWSLFALVLFLWSDYEERRLAKKFGEEFIEYRRRTGAFFPRIFNKNKERKSFEEITYWKRYLFTFLAYSGFVLILYLLVYILSLPSINIMHF